MNSCMAYAYTLFRGVQVAALILVRAKSIN